MGNQPDTDSGSATTMRLTDIPGWDAEDKHGYLRGDDLDDWLLANGFEVVYARRPGLDITEVAYWNKDAAILVLTMPDGREPDRDEFMAFENIKSLLAVGSKCDEWWAGMDDPYDGCED